MQRGDLALFYHTGDEKRIVGCVRVMRGAYPDPDDKAGKLVVVDVQADAPAATPVTLAQVKAEPKFAHLALVKQARLSVMPIDPPAWALLCRMAGISD